MYLCFEQDDKRSAFPEDSLVVVDDNGFTVRGNIFNRQGHNMQFFKTESFKGACQNLNQAISWVRKAGQKRTEGQPAPAATPKASDLPQAKF